MDLAIRFPAQGRIHLESHFLFSEPHDSNCRQFVERVFQAPEITEVTIRSQPGRQVPRAELGFCPRTYTLKQVVERVTVLLNPRKRSANGSHHRKREPERAAIPTATTHQTGMRSPISRGIRLRQWNTRV